MRRRFFNLRTWRTLTLGWATLVLYLTLAPAGALPPTPAWKLLSFDTAAHAGVFLVLVLPLARWWQAAGRPRPLSSALVAAIFFGALIEVLQSLMPLGRHGEWSDLLSDGLGALAGCGLARLPWGRPAGPPAGPPAPPLRGLLPLLLPVAGLLLAGRPAFAQNVPAPPVPWRPYTGPEADSLRARARRMLTTLADTPMAGRGYAPADGARRAAGWVRHRFQALGLAPAGDSGGTSYFQHFPLAVNTFPGSVAFTVDGQPLRPGFDFIVDPTCPTVVRRRARVVRFDTTLLAGADSAALHRRLRPRRLTKCVVVLRAADEKRLATASHGLRRWLGGAAALVVLQPRKLTASLAPYQAAQARLLVPLAAWPARARRVSLTVNARLAPAWPVRNVLARLPGTAPGLADSALVLTAHYDHLGQLGPATYFPGANDNASGVAMLLALAADLRARPLRHPVYFMAFGAEEAGLVGSTWCATHPPLPLANVRFLLNLDLLGAGEDGLGVVGATLHPRPYRLLDSLNRHLGAVPRFKPRGRAANSDHFPFAERGVPAFFVYAMGGPPWYHDVQDTAAAVPLSRFPELFRLLNAFLRGLDGGAVN